MTTLASALTAESLLEWVKLSDWVMVTTCGRFRCRKFYAGDVLNEPGPVRYQLIGPDGITRGAPQASFEHVERLAERLP
jgi:hypothetical protein